MNETFSVWHIRTLLRREEMPGEPLRPFKTKKNLKETNSYHSFHTIKRRLRMSLKEYAMMSLTFLINHCLWIRKIQKLLCSSKRWKVIILDTLVNSCKETKESKWSIAHKIRTSVRLRKQRNWRQLTQLDLDLHSIIQCSTMRFSTSPILHASLPRMHSIMLSKSWRQLKKRSTEIPRLLCSCSEII